jgi:hypothetical protein
VTADAGARARLVERDERAVEVQIGRRQIVREHRDA